MKERVRAGLVGSQFIASIHAVFLLYSRVRAALHRRRAGGRGLAGVHLFADEAALEA